ncbi:MAG: hypothetical protein Q9M43_13395 [Sulfurimonas sp.]|nr:hypothetical protein [Sulfurimonas sp.]
MKFIHIGYPKNLSTTLQNDFFAKHSELNYLGIGFNSENIKYKNSDYSIYFDGLIRARDIEFKELHHSFFDRLHKNLSDNYGISHENLSFHFSNDEVDITQKVDRLFDFFGNNTKIIVVIRNQFDLIKSIYKESLKAGLSIDFYDYINMLYRNKFHSYLQEFQFDKVLDIYKNKFGMNNILILPIEEYKINSKLKKVNEKYLFLDEICGFLNIKYENLNLNHNNPSLNNKEAFHLLELNKRYRYNLGKGDYSLIDIHKYKDIFSYLDYTESDIYHDVKMKRNLLEYSTKLAKDDPREIDYYADPKIIEKLRIMFIKSNERLSKNFNIELPDNYFEMEL